MNKICPQCKKEMTPFGKEGTSVSGFFYCKMCKIFTHGIFVFQQGVIKNES